MSRAKSHAEREAASHAVQELARGRSKESMAWDLVHRHDNEIGHVNRRIETLEAGNGEIRSSLQEIRDELREADALAQATSDKVEHIETMQAKQATTTAEQERYRRSLRNDLFRNLVALASLLTALAAMFSKNCYR